MIKNQMLPFVTIWVNPELSQTKTETVWYHLNVEPLTAEPVERDSRVVVTSGAAW